MKVKICGITTEEDAEICNAAGADMLGFVHVPGRLRSVSLEKISDICSSLRPGVTKVLVCSPCDERSAVEMFERSGANVLQLCSLGPEEAKSLRENGISVMRMVKPDKSEAEQFSTAVDCLVYEKGDPGTGTAYDYSSIPLGTCIREIIAGGLTLENVHEALALAPYGVDVSSGVESVLGRKDPDKVASFVRRCRE